MTDPSGTPSTPPPPPAYPTAPPPAATSAGPGAPVPGKTMGIVALILAFFFQLGGLILGIIALVQSRKAGVKNTPALWAIIVSAVLMVVGIILMIVIIGGLAAGSAALLERCAELGPGTHVIDGVTFTCS
ncbi:MAG: hypothetical protein K0R60_528 [Microbacterium sp.]|jgi:hypothetical protein|nr:hypothetical protein [Microbacterium sp.]